LIALVELGTRVLIDFGMSRRAAVAVLAMVGFLCGLPSALSTNLFGNQDWVWGLGLIVSGGFLAFGVLRYGVRRFRHDFLSVSPRQTGAWFNLFIAGLIPIQFFCMMGWWFYQAFEWTESSDRNPLQRLLAWLDPTNLYSIGTCVVQWGILLIAGLILNRWMARRLAMRERR